MPADAVTVISTGTVTVSPGLACSSGMKIVGSGPPLGGGRQARRQRGDVRDVHQADDPLDARGIVGLDLAVERDVADQGGSAIGKAGKPLLISPMTRCSSVTSGVS